VSHFQQQTLLRNHLGFLSGDLKNSASKASTSLKNEPQRGAGQRRGPLR
jgi:hypothetical protein